MQIVFQLFLEFKIYSQILTMTCHLSKHGLCINLVFVFNLLILIIIIIIIFLININNNNYNNNT